MPTSWMRGAEWSYLYMWTRGFAHLNPVWESLFFFFMRICLFSSLFQILTVHLRVSRGFLRLLNSEQVRVAAQMSWVSLINQFGSSKIMLKMGNKINKQTAITPTAWSHHYVEHFPFIWTSSGPVSEARPSPQGLHSKMGFKSIWTFNFYQSISLCWKKKNAATD